MTGPDALGVLSAAPTPSLGRTLSRSRIAAVIARAGRQRNIDTRAAEFQTVVRAEQLTAPAPVADAMGAATTALVAVITTLNTQIARLEEPLADACHLWAFAALTASPGARAYYDARRAGGDTHNRALRALANRLVGLLHGCLRHRTLYDEHTAWDHRAELVTPAA